MPPGDERPNGDATYDMAMPSAGPAPDQLRAGGLLGQYRLLERIGAGGMGQVFKAIHPTMQRVVAVKIMAANLVEDARARARFRREVQSAARLAHPNIVMAYDAAEEAGCCFLVMEYVEGHDAGALLHEHGPVPLGMACEIVRQVALGLQHAHEQGMIHRDIKPGNLVIAPRRPPRDGGIVSPPPPGWPADPVVKILDFGLARFQAGESDLAVHVPGSTPLTREGHVVGTPEFMSPEQACNSGRTDIRSDIYSLGCTFYCLLTGQPPFTGPSLLEIMVQHLQSSPPSVTLLRPDVPPALAAVVERMLAKRPEDRYQEPGEVAAALLPFVNALAPTEAVVLQGQPVNLFPETRTSTPLINPTVAIPAAPRPRASDRAAPSAARTCFGCVGLMMVLICSMIVAWMYLLRNDGKPQPDAPSDSPRPGPVPGMLLVRFPAGRYDPSFGPGRSHVEISRDFEVSATEVTQAQFGLFVQVKGFRTDAEKGTGGELGAVLRTASGGSSWNKSAAWDTWQQGLSGDMPVVCVSWEDAVQFCNWLSEREKLPLCYRLAGGPGDWECNFQAPGYRLPTEAEWEYAARAGDRVPCPTSKDALQQGWFLENSKGQLHPTGDRAKNRRDLCDVWGNAWEWCWDRHSPTIGLRSPLSPTGPESGEQRVARGGGWCDPAPFNASQTRKCWPPDHRASDVGFRVVRTIPSK